MNNALESADKGFPIFTSYGTILFLDANSGRVRHGFFEFSPRNVFGVRRGGQMEIVAETSDARRKIEIMPDASLAECSPALDLADPTAVKFEVLDLRRGEFGLSVEGVYLSAQPDGGLTVDRGVCSDWEAFHVPDEFDECSGTIVSQRVDGRIIRFFITNRSDWIQRHQCRGNFYERDELDIVRSYCRPERTTLDIGANIGNHAIFFSVICGVSRVIAFEPNPDAIRILNANLSLNSCATVDTRYLGFALGSDKGSCWLQDTAVNNLGGAKVVPDPEGDVRVIMGDDVVLNEPVGFIKIDVEGMEFDVLGGLTRTIERWRPNIFIEVWRGALDSLTQWIAEYNYKIVWAEGDNFLLLPSEHGAR